MISLAHLPYPPAPDNVDPMLWEAAMALARLLAVREFKKRQAEADAASAGEVTTPHPEVTPDRPPE